MTDVNIDFDSPEVKQAIADRAAKLTEQQVAAKLADYVPASEIEGLKNKNTELLGKLQEFKGFDKDKYAQYEEFQRRVEKDEMLKLAADGHFEELSNKLMSSQQKAWNETQSEYEERLANAQKQAEEFQAKAEQLDSEYKTLQKRQYFKDLTAGDDSFKGDYFSDFFELQSRRAEIDPESGEVFALEDDGKRQIDTDGNFVKFEDYYTKLKQKHGLFWNGGSGSGQKGGKGGDAMGSDPAKWTHEQKLDFMAQNGRQAYAELLAKANQR